MTIKNMIEEYERKLDDMERDARDEHSLCNSYLTGKIAAYRQVLEDLYEMNWSEEE